MKIQIAILAGLCLMASSVYAQTASTSDASTSSTKLQGQTPSAAKRKNIDEEITNNLLRASTGAKSLLSLQSTFNYNGSSIQNPTGQTRPQINPAQPQLPVEFTGGIAAKYRLSDHDNLSAGINFGWLAPGREIQSFQVEDPNITYSRPFKAGAFQNVFEAVLTKYTSAAFSINRNDNYQVDVDHTILYEVAKTHLQIGLNIAYTRDTYKGMLGSGSGQPVDDLNAYPYIEYAFNPTLNFRTVFRGFGYYNTLQDSGTFYHETATQSAGLGIAVTRDIFLYPNLQWIWVAMSTAQSNVALAAYINL